jgi:hypothetical protein
MGKNALLPILVSCVLCTASGQAEPSRMTVTGTVLFVGNAPFTELVIRDKQGRDWLIGGEDAALLDGLADREVTVLGTAQERELRFANSVKTIKQRSLARIELIEPRGTPKPQ